MVLRGEQNTVLVTMELNVCHHLSANPHLLCNASLMSAGPSALSADNLLQEKWSCRLTIPTGSPFHCNLNNAGVFSPFVAIFLLFFLWEDLIILLRIESKKKQHFLFPRIMLIFSSHDKIVFFSSIIYSVKCFIENSA